MTFKELGLPPHLLSRLERLGFVTPTPIQEQAIPLALAGQDILGIAKTGTGKTAAFGLPLITTLLAEKQRPAPRTVRGLVLAPTRELATQIVKSLTDFSRTLRVALVVGGKGINGQIARLERGSDIMVATPGRLLDLLDRRAVDLRPTRFLVLDEADQMLDIGFAHALKRIATMLGEERQTMMFSATMPQQMAKLARDYLRDPARVEVSPPGETADKVAQSVHFVAKEKKQTLLIGLLGEHRGERSLVFTRTKHGAERLMRHLAAAGFSSASIHGNKSQGQRERALASFRKGDVVVLVATDVAARGLDIPDVRFVYNYDLPNVPENYVHRIGRTARAGRDGEAIAFCAADETAELKAIEKLLKGPLTVAGGTRWQGADILRKPAPARRGGPRRPRPQGSRPQGLQAKRPAGAKPGNRGDNRSRVRREAAPA